MMIALGELFRWEKAASHLTAWHLGWRRRGDELVVRASLPAETELLLPRGGRWAAPCVERCADSPGKYHPLYAAAMLEAGVFEASEEVEAWRVPAVAFSTDEWTRRSMTLNGMRMSTEFYQTGSERVLTLLQNRMADGQADVIHDVLVFQLRRVVDMRRHAVEARRLRAESLAAYLGVDRAPVEAMMRESRVTPARLAERLQNGEAGVIRRALDVPKLAANQMRLLRPELSKIAGRERTARHLLERSAALLAVSS